MYSRRIPTINAAIAFLLTVLIGQAAFSQPVQPTQPRQTQPQQAPQQTESADAQMDQARAALRNKDFDSAIRILGPLAQQGHPEAQFFVALMYSRGDGVQQNQQEAVRWYTLSALQGWSDSMFNLGQQYYRGEGVERNLTYAADLFFLTATTGDADGQWATGLCFAHGEGRQQDVIEGCAWLLLAANQNHEAARQELEQLTQQVTQEQWDTARSLAETLQELTVNRQFDPNKIPKVPVPPFMSDQPLPQQQQPQPQQQQQQQQKAQPLIVEFTSEAEILPVGDVRGTARFDWPAEAYDIMKANVPNPRYYLRDLTTGRSDVELAPDATARYDDANKAVILGLHMLGAVKNEGRGRWIMEFDEEEFVSLTPTSDGRFTALFNMQQDLEEDLIIRGRMSLTTPAGASDVQYNAAKKAIIYKLPYTGPNGEGRLDITFDARDQLMSCLYKVYGLETDFAAHWVAKAVITNVGDGPIRDLRIRYRLGDYSELDMWQKYPEVLPGQTVVSTYHPVLKKSTAEMTSTTPANLLTEWRYKDAEGRTVEDSDGERISILGRHEFVFSNLKEEESLGNYYDAFSNSDFIAAWVTRDDPVVKRFAAMANKAAGGEGAPYSDEAAYKVLRACYELMQANNFTYQGPVGIVDQNISFDNKIVQSIKFPRDVIRDKSGTCIELAALYCSMAHSIGLSPYMILVPGHAFPVVKLPSGNYLPVETTGVGGGQRYGTAPFDKVVEAAADTYEKSAKQGMIIEVDVEDCWARGVSSPELEQVPADILERWNIVLTPPTPGPTPGPTPAPGPGPAPGPSPNPGPSNAAAFVGNWAGQASQPMPDGSTMTYPMVMEVTQSGGNYKADWYGEAHVQNQWGGSSHIKVFESFTGQVQGGGMSMNGTQKTLTVDGQQMPMPTDTMTLQVSGNEVQGTVTLAQGGGTVTFRATRQQ